MHSFSFILATVLYKATVILASPKNYNYVAVFSIDGFHSSDVGKYVTLRPNSTLAQLLETGYEYTNAYTSAPSDSFPGTVAQFTGASPITTSVWYDDIWYRDYYPPFSVNGTHCQGPPGAEGQSFCAMECFFPVRRLTKNYSRRHRRLRLQQDRALLWWHQPRQPTSKSCRRHMSRNIPS